ncbi:GH92 family glycosyl hydrolase [Cohnella phaseoli]|uniref:Putative alpha-1,2-mannosidase n=1 Tax=Cohnella phaseoli TaxID=456490 RepID=A0A3D9JTR0_9BACL|nr:GH92 family glycosyl hydrolase [Cohnella phaseoli]RED76836.1 putative alpha-1,2-mannosidase [Cohnella phaseoli]
MERLSYVNPLQGTASVYEYSYGNTLPLVSRPFGMASWSLQTREVKDGWFFHPSDRRLNGVRLTRQPSPWIGDYGQLLLLPQTGPSCLAPELRPSSYEPEKSTLRPDYLSVRFSRYRASLELTPAERSAAIRLAYEDSRNARLLLATYEGESSFQFDYAARTLSGFTRASRGGTPDNFALYFVIAFDCELDETACDIYNAEFAPVGALSHTGEQLSASVGLKLPTDGTTQAKIGLSFISLEQAALNMERELGDADFDELRSQAAAEWEERLGTIEIKSDEAVDQLRTFYTCLYRTFLFPRKSYELDASGRTVHYSPFNGKLCEGPMYSDVGFWDVYRTTVPLFSLLCPRELGEMLQSWVLAYKESGWMPKWVSPGERGAMPGTLIDAVFADAIAKEIDGFDAQTAYQGLLKHATLPPDRDMVGREGLDHYIRLGYLPDELVHHSVSHSLDYAYGDFCLSVIARALGDGESQLALSERARNYRLLFDAEVGFMHGRQESGAWRPDFNPLDWGGPYCEGGAWQCSWAVQHDIRGYAELLGGSEQMVRKLDELFAAKPHFNVGSYGMEIHEMSEMAAADLGQFAISNQPSFHFPYLFTALGAPSRTQYWARKTMEEHFSAEPNGLPGDEDNGSLSAWYIFGAMGMYPLCPGVPEYTLGSPLFGSMSVKLQNGRRLDIQSVNNSSDHKYVKSVALNGETHEKLFFTHAQLTEGAKIVFQMTDEAILQSYSPQQLPFSQSDVSDCG